MSKPEPHEPPCGEFSAHAERCFLAVDPQEYMGPSGLYEFAYDAMASYDDERIAADPEAPAIIADLMRPEPHPPGRRTWDDIKREKGAA